MDLESPGERIRWAITEHAGMKLGIAAERIGVPQPSLSRWLRRNSAPPTDGYLVKIAELTGVPAGWLRYGAPEEERPEDAVYDPHAAANGEVREAAEDSPFRDLADIARTLRSIGPPGMDYKDKRGALDAIADYYAHVGKRRPQEWWDLHEALEAGKI